MEKHVALLGDSVFDNAAYVEGGPDVIGQLKEALPVGWQATLLAMDGSVIDDVRDQVEAVSDDVSHVVLSIGGNDVLANLDVMSQSVRTTTESLGRLLERVTKFERSYRVMLSLLRERRLPTTVSTIYNGNLTQADAPLLGLGKADISVLRVGLSPFNDAILRIAFENDLNVIDLRLVCSEPEDYANPIEPSSRGGKKIARAIVRALGLTGDPKIGSRIFC